MKATTMYGSGRKRALQVGILIMLLAGSVLIFVRDGGEPMDQAAYYRSHPPRCIAGFSARPAESPGVESDGHASPSQLDVDPPPGVTIEGPEYSNPAFALFCRCGGSRHYVHGYRWINRDYRNAVVFLSPLVLECAACGSMTDLIDTDVHGYDAELGLGSTTARGLGDPVVFECPRCGRQPLETLVQFEYPDDLFGDDFRDFAGRQQDLFTWFNLFGKCPSCSQVLRITDFECA
ncbi:MAG: hypothetical protein GY778_21695 [bacterium]|nr:hypothetical protein [bacterium]